jgi:hypothetical protein
MLKRSVPAFCVTIITAIVLHVLLYTTFHPLIISFRVIFEVTKGLKHFLFELVYEGREER